MARPVLRLLALLGLLWPLPHLGAQSRSEAEIVRLWEEGQWEPAFALITAARSATGAAPVWDLLAAVAFDLGLGTYRSAYDAQTLYVAAMRRGEARARLALVDLLREDSSPSAADARLLAACQAVLKTADPADRRLQLGPFHFGLPAARRQNLAHAFTLNREAALETNALWATYNTSALMGYNPRGTLDSHYRQQELWRRRALAQGAGPLLHQNAFMASFGIEDATDTEQMIASYTRAAEGGYPDSQWEMGQRYLRGKGVEKDLEKAVALLSAAAAGDADRLSDLALLYHNGEFLPKDMAAARLWYERAVAAGDGFSANELGRFYAHGWAHTPVDPVRAQSLYRLAANRGSWWGKFNLAMSLLTPEATEAELAEGRFWLLEAGYEGHEDAVASLLQFYRTGEFGFPIDHEKNWFWAEWELAKNPQGMEFLALERLWRADPIDWDALENAARHALGGSSPSLGFAALHRMAEDPRTPPSQVGDVIALAREHAAQIPLARRILIEELTQAHLETGSDPAEIREHLAALEAAPAEGAEIGIRSVLLFPEWFTDPLAAYLRFVEALPTTSPLGPILPLAEPPASLEAVMAHIVQTVTYEPLSEPQKEPYGARGRPLLTAASPQFSGALATFAHSDSIRLELQIAPDGSTTARAVEGRFELYKRIAEASFSRWKWAPDPEAEPLIFRISMPIHIH